MWIGIAVGGVFVIVFLVSTLMPQSMADFFMSFGASGYSVELENGEMRTVEFTELGDGVEPDDRLFLMKKMIALHVLADYVPQYEDELAEFNNALITASEDNILDSIEFLDLKKMHGDFMPEERVNDWINMAKELEKRDIEMQRGSDQQ